MYVESSNFVITTKKYFKAILQKRSGNSEMRSYIYWPKLHKVIQNTIRKRNGCNSEVKLPPTNCQTGTSTDKLWERLHMYFVGPTKSSYYLTVVDRFTKWPYIWKCKQLTIAITVKFLCELFARFGEPDGVGTDNEIQFTTREFKSSCKYTRPLNIWQRRFIIRGGMIKRKVFLTLSKVR